MQKKKRMNKNCTCRKYFGYSWIYEQTQSYFKAEFKEPIN